MITILTRVVFVALILTLSGCRPSAKICAVCQRAECREMAFQMTLENGRTIETCCPRCGLHYLAANHLTARSLRATEYLSGERLDVAALTFVSGSDVHGCSSMEARRETPGCCLLKTYDRCLPSLVAFRNREQATEFRKAHGGDLIVFADLLSKEEKPQTSGGGKS